MHSGADLQSNTAVQETIVMYYQEILEIDVNL
ncbi:hypothetical protein NBC122_02863 [Chryseobacterium salivictor]|uniref:Uncharacterized protein n=1 Tax=Chryseobacterium salivictor TaxID=2547600 RepID=A0A4P6ZIS3_9FLAO|nr:hypothetical protein NBC122_02863 [Chryseobacterium salivictor]